MMSTATIADWRGASVSGKKVVAAKHCAVERTWIEARQVTLTVI
jgi:hypothetical protein